MMHHSIRYLLTGCAVFILQAGQAYAQTIDYGGLQDLFGEPVTTSATGKPQKVSDVPVAMDIITAEDIRRSGAQNIPDVLSRVDGVLSWQGTRDWSDVGMRGRNQSYNPTLLVLVNGRQVYIDTYGFTDWTLLPVQMEEIRQIEVVKGPNTALFGFNAVDGVINIVTYNPKYDKINEVGGTIGTGKYAKGHLIDTLNLSEQTQMRVSGSLQTENEFGHNSKTPFATYGYQNTNHIGRFNTDAISQLNDKTQLRLELGYSDANTNDSVFYIPTDSQNTTDSGKLTLTSQTNYGLIEGSVYRNEVRLEQNSVRGALNQDNAVTVATLQDLFKIGDDHSVRISGEYRQNTMSSTALLGDGVDISYNLGAVGAMWNWAITPQWEWTNAVRIDSLFLNRSGPAPTAYYTSNDAFDKTTTAWSANSGVTYKVTPEDTLRASFARGIQVPALIVDALQLNLGSFVAVGDPSLNPSVVTNYEIGYDTQIKEINGKFRSTLFYRRAEDVFTVGGNNFIIGPTTVSQVASVGHTDTKGLELSLGGKMMQDWTWNLGYAYQNTDDSFSAATGNGTPAPIDYAQTYPHHVFNAHLGWAKGPWEVDGYGQAASDFNQWGTTNVGSSYDLYKIDNYEVLAGRIGYNFDDGLTLALSGKNLTQARVALNGGLENEAEVFVSVSKKF